MGGAAHRHRRPGARMETGDLWFAPVLLLLAYAITLAVWAGHRALLGAEAGHSTSRVVTTGALFGTMSALSGAFTRAPSGRLRAAAAGMVAALLVGLVLRLLLGQPDGSLPRDAVPPLLSFGVGSLLCLGLLARPVRGRAGGTEASN